MTPTLPNGQAQASQLAARLDSLQGKVRTAFSPDYQARTSDPQDCCYVGRSISSNKPTAAQRPDAAYGITIRRDSRGFAMWGLLVRRGEPMTAGEIAVHLNCPVKTVNGTASRLVKGQALVIRRVGQRHEYSIGPMPVVEA
jgi:hypothetical protein